MNAFLKTHLKLASFSHRFFMKFHYFFGIDFRIVFFIVFWWKWLPKWMVAETRGTPQKHQICSLFATFSEDRFFDAFWSPLGSLLAPFWLPLAHFWLPLAHFWLPLAHFWLPLAPFWLTFGVPWLTLVPFASLLLTQGSIISLLLYPVLILRILLNFPWKYRAKTDS